MDNVLNWGEGFTLSLQNLWYRIITFLPQLFGALIVLIIGLIIATALSKLIFKLIGYTNIDRKIEQIPAMRKIKEQGIDLRLSTIIAKLVKWFFIIVTLITIIDILDLPELNKFLESIIAYLPNVIVAIAILAIGLVIGEVMGDIIKKSALISHFTPGPVLGNITKWAIIVFSFMASLVQLGIARSLIEILFTGLVAGSSLAFGLAFGLGGQEKAGKLLEQMVRIDKDRPKSP